jgi:hypothetical protein
MKTNKNDNDKDDGRGIEGQVGVGAGLKPALIREAEEKRVFLSYLGHQWIESRRFYYCIPHLVRITAVLGHYKYINPYCRGVIRPLCVTVAIRGLLLAQNTFLFVAVAGRIS